MKSLWENNLASMEKVATKLQKSTTKDNLVSTNKILSYQLVKVTLNNQYDLNSDVTLKKLGDLMINHEKQHICTFDP